MIRCEVKHCQKECSVCRLKTDENRPILNKLKQLREAQIHLNLTKAINK